MRVGMPTPVDNSPLSIALLAELSRPHDAPLSCLAPDLYTDSCCRRPMPSFGTMVAFTFYGASTGQENTERETVPDTISLPFPVPSGTVGGVIMSLPSLDSPAE